MTYDSFGHDGGIRTRWDLDRRTEIENLYAPSRSPASCGLWLLRKFVDTDEPSGCLRFKENTPPKLWFHSALVHRDYIMNL